MKNIKVLIVEDSKVVQEFLAHLIGSDPALRVVGVAGDGEEALALVRDLKPDVITMDIHMPKMDGFETTRLIMETLPTPIVIVSAVTRLKEAAYTFRLLEAGALAVVQRPPGFDSPAHKETAEELLQTVRLMSEVKVVKRLGGSRDKAGPCAPEPARASRTDIALIAIGASTGGPMVLQKILSRLPADLSVPVLIVQHIPAEFTEGFADWLGSSILLPVGIAAHGEKALPGRCYLAPGNMHIGVTRGLAIELSGEPPHSGLRPSVGYLFSSVARCLGPRGAGVLLSGMGRDGAAELKEMRDSGAVTIAQDEESCVVYGMPGEAAALGAAEYILPPGQIAELLSSLVKQGRL